MMLKAPPLQKKMATKLSLGKQKKPQKNKGSLPSAP